MVHVVERVAEYDHRRPFGPFRMVAVIRRRFVLEDDGDGGSVDVETDVRWDWTECRGYFAVVEDWSDSGLPALVIRETPVREAADLIRSEYLEFRATGGGWAALPDGSRTVDYRTGEEEEVSAHLFGFTPAEARAVERMVDWTSPRVR